MSVEALVFKHKLNPPLYESALDHSTRGGEPSFFPFSTLDAPPL